MVFRAPFGTGAATTATTWYLAGGIDAANCVAAYQPKGAASHALSYVNLANPGTYDAAPGTAPTWDQATGWIFNGTSQYLTTGIVPATDQTWSAVVKFSDSIPSNGVLFDAVDDPRYFAIAPQTTTSPGYQTYFNNGSYRDFTFGDSAGIFTLVGDKAGRNSWLDPLVTIPTASGVNTAPIYIGCRSGSSLWFTGKIQALAFYNIILSTSQLLAIVSAIKAIYSPIMNVWGIGDSKTIASLDGYRGYQPVLCDLLTSSTGKKWFETPDRSVLEGGNTFDGVSIINAGVLGTIPDSPIPDYILLNMGVNDIGTYDISQADFEANYGIILDALHAKFPSAMMYLMRIGNGAFSAPQTTKQNLMDDTWIPNILSSRGSFAFLGPDERVFLENGDGYTTLTVDLCHPNVAGYAATAAAWKTVIGL